MPLKVLIIGTGSQARYAIDILSDGDTSHLALIEIEKKENVGKFINGVPVACLVADVPKRFPSQDCEVVIGYGKGKRKQELAKYFKEHNYSFLNVISPHAVISPTATLGKGCIINPGAVVMPNAHIGNHVILHSGCVVEHDNVLRDFANLAPGVVLAGRVTVGEGSVLYTGAKVVPDVTIGDWVEVAAGSVVTKDVPSKTRVGGSPARRLIPVS